MNRRYATQAFAALIGALAVGCVTAQQIKPRIASVGLLSGTRIDERENEALHLGLKDAGYSPGSNVVIDFRSAEGHYDRLPTLATALVQQRVNLIIAVGGTVAALAAKNATATIPIVFTTAGDPVKLGLVSGLSRPGANLTGVTFLSSGLSAKRLQILREMVPSAKNIGFLINPANPNIASERKEVESAAASLGQKMHVMEAGDESHIDQAFAKFAAEKVDGVIVAADAIYRSHGQHIAALAIHYRLPAIYALPEFVVAGGLVSYGASRTEAYRLVGRYAGRILNGERPAELPVQQSTTVGLTINLTAVKILGLKLSSNFLARADEIIE
jgi:putative ABC transport system substrate-binding protein